MGKTGGHELNYVSDVDVIFVHEPAEGADEQRGRDRRDPAGVRDHADLPRPHRRGHDLGGRRRTCARRARTDRWSARSAATSRTTSGGRARGSSRRCSRRGSPRATTSWARRTSTRSRRWSGRPPRDRTSSPTSGAMRRRVIENIPAAHRDRQLKLGAGGLRDVEFAVQLLQLVHGRADEQLRSPTTAGGAARADRRRLRRSSRRLRRWRRRTSSCATLEHRIQLVPAAAHPPRPDDPERPAPDRPQHGLPAPTRPTTCVKEWQAHRRIVRRLHEKLFYRPLLEAVASLPSRRACGSRRRRPRHRLDGARLSRPAGALTHIAALTSGVARRAAIQRRCCRRCSRGSRSRPNPDGGLLAFRKISEELGDDATGTCASCATRAPAPSSSRTCCSSSTATSPT